MTELDAQDKRIDDILDNTNGETFEDCIDRFYTHLTGAVKLPCDVTGIEDFRWEEYYIFGPGDANEYGRLQKNQPSYQDIFELLAIEKDVFSEWMMFQGEDLAAHVRRKSDGKEFYLGLAEVEAKDKASLNHKLLDDYAVWFVNNR